MRHRPGAWIILAMAAAGGLAFTGTSDARVRPTLTGVAYQEQEAARRQQQASPGLPPQEEQPGRPLRGQPGQQSGDLVQGAIAVEPTEVLAGMFYDGATIRVSAVVPRGTGVAVVCTGESQPLVLNRKGRALGFLWMNVGEVSFRSVPGVYLVRTSEPLADMEATVEEPGVGFDALARDCGSDSAGAAMFDELVRLKESDGLWGVAEGVVHLQPAEEGTALATTDIRLPAAAKPGVYRVLVYTFASDGRELVGSAEIPVRRVGMSAFIVSLANRHGTVYGIMAALVAVAVGLLTGLFFGMGSKHGH